MSDTDFWITPDGLVDQARAFDQCAQLVGDGKTWVDEHPVGDSSDYPLYSGAAEQAIDISTGLSVFLGHVQEVLVGVGTELRDVAAEAETMDMTSAAELDAYDPDEYNDFDPDAPGRRSDAELAPPTDRTYDGSLFPVYPLNGGGIAFYCDAGGQYDNLDEQGTALLPGDLLSPSEWVWTVMGWIGAQSIKEDLLGIFGGRWSELYEFRFMLEGISTMLSEVADNLESAKGALSVYWQGYAANSAQDYFEHLLEQLRDASSEIGDAAGQFSQFLQGVELEFDALSGAAHGFIDAILVAAAAAGAGTATAPSGIGPVVGYGTAGVSLLWALKCAKEVWDGVQDALTILTLLDAVRHLSADLSDVTTDLHIPTMETTG